MKVGNVIRVEHIISKVKEIIGFDYIFLII